MVTIILFVLVVGICLRVWAQWLHETPPPKQENEASAYCAGCKMPYPLSDLRYIGLGCYLCRWHYEKGRVV